MHRCLLVPEILEHIFSDVYLSGTEGGSQHYWKDDSIPPKRHVSRRSLASLCRACHSFKDVALDVLWAELDTLEPLFTCLPLDLWWHETNIIMKRPVTPADWSIFEQYASRVRVLGGKDSDIFGRIDKELIEAMMAFSSKLFLPNLRALCCGNCPLGLHSCMRYLLGPNLVDLRLLSKTGQFWNNAIYSVLSPGLGSYSPRLKTIVLHDTSPQVTELALSTLPILRSVTLGVLSDKILNFISRLIDLEVLDIKILDDLRGTKVQFSANLCKLIIRADTLALSVDTLEGWGVKCGVLQLISNIPETPLAVENVLRKLSDHALCDGLEVIQLHTPKSVGHNHYTFHTSTLTIFLRIFTALLRFSGLKRIHLSTFCMSWLDDGALGSIVKSLPHLEELVIGTRYFWLTPPKITLKGIVTVLSSCPNLRVLGLVFDATKLGPPTQMLGDGVCNTNITSLRVGFSPIEQTPGVAVALWEILPCLSEIHLEFDTHAPDRDARMTKWGDAMKYINYHRLVWNRYGF
ncbi:hypothetical protein K503DRAFT_774358 [Rhizopogon vinicolor AM-OR11-026]|uniref:F-box domain-containing protein n=1 Tax=Rhizopogon vinicolor AM-OR11-026 TaxID=1314800 RepID=A0A1B7MPZ2_9AGAM|nr:hypothetical protein K503DRAFT_774358 [Rhizopogon vinicolor AM-OR11-026]